jgi:uncharacterized integral membrane protein (TIGR00697 family)
LTRTAVVVVALYIGAQMLSDLTSLKIGLIAGLAVDMGTFIYPITFTLRDVAHKTIGKRHTQLLIWLAAAVDLFAVAYFWWVGGVPGDPVWGLEAEWEAIFSVNVLGRIVLASIVAEVVSELVDTEVYHWFVTRITRRRQWGACAGQQQRQRAESTTSIFAVGAFGWLLPWEVVWQIFCSTWRSNWG